MMCASKPNAPHHLGCVVQSPARCQRRLSHPATPEGVGRVRVTSTHALGAPRGRARGTNARARHSAGVRRRGHHRPLGRIPLAAHDHRFAPQLRAPGHLYRSKELIQVDIQHPPRDIRPCWHNPQYAAAELEDLGPAGTNLQRSSPMFCTALMSVEPTLLAVCAPCVSQTRSHHSALLTAAMDCQLAARASLPVQPSNRPDRETRRLSALAVAALFSTRVLCGIAYWQVARDRQICAGRGALLRPTGCGAV
jgi:hypothetical protein